MWLAMDMVSLKVAPMFLSLCDVLTEAPLSEILSVETFPLKCGVLNITTSVFFIKFEPVIRYPLANFINAMFKLFNGTCKEFSLEGQSLHTTVYLRIHMILEMMLSDDVTHRKNID